MRTYKDNAKEYALKLLKRKNYFIKELYVKLKIRYQDDEVNEAIKDLIKTDLLNDKLLVEMKTYFLLHIKMYGKKYIVNYFLSKGISLNLINYILYKYSNAVFINNMNKIKKDLERKGRSEEYIYNFLLRRGYSEEEIKSM
ncbi:MAG: RecX family transcriptional regulator [Bacilli bacterium]|nr:RecX family transcriptional regulator [Bacilli bacterium]